MAVAELRDALDHPVFFVMVLAVAVACMTSIYVWIFKALNMPGPAGLFQHP